MSPRGFEGLKQASDAIEAKKSSGGAYYRGLYFRLPSSGDKAIVRFVDEQDEVAWAYMHSYAVPGRAYDAQIACLDQLGEGEDCPGCERDLPRRIKMWTNVLWRDAPVFERDNEGKVIKKGSQFVETGEHEDQVAVWSAGIKIYNILEEIEEDFGMTSRDFRVKRKGEGLATEYTIAPAVPDGGPKSASKSDQELIANKTDLSIFLKLTSYEEFEDRLPGGSVTGGSRDSGQDLADVNPFKSKSKSK